LDYLASDYSGAVLEGKIISSTEYEEQVEFAEKITSNLATYNQKEILQKGLLLKKLIADKKDANKKKKMARAVQRDLIQVTNIKLAPEVWPSIKRGAQLYKTNCMNCHGDKGYGDGIDGRQMITPPANFHNKLRMNTISAFHCYNAIRLGIPGTGMLGFDHLDDKEIWDLAFYIMSIPYAADNTSNKSFETNITLEEISSLNNNQIKEKYHIPLDDNTLISQLRSANREYSFLDYLNIAKRTLGEVLPYYLHAEYENAKKLAIQSYLQGIEPIEPIIKVSRPDLIIEIEVSMSEIRRLTTIKGQEKQLEIEISKMQNLFTVIQKTLSEKKISFSVAVLGTFAIVLREGLEAVLLLLTLLSVVRAMKNKKAMRIIHYGWSSAVLLGFILWFASGEIINISGVGRETMEAFTALVAVLALLYFGFWLHQKTEINKWKEFIHSKINNAILDKNVFTLFSISFMAVFREAIETVLFIRSIWFQTSEQDQIAIPIGLGISVVLIGIIAYFMLKYTKKIPLRKLFQISSIMMTGLAIVLTGKAVHSFQEIGYISAHNFPLNIRMDFFGLFPNWEGLGAQLVLSVIMYFFLVDNPAKR